MLVAVRAERILFRGDTDLHSKNTANFDKFGTIDYVRLFHQA